MTRSCASVMTRHPPLSATNWGVDESPRPTRADMSLSPPSGSLQQSARQTGRELDTRVWHEGSIQIAWLTSIPASLNTRPTRFELRSAGCSSAVVSFAMTSQHEDGSNETTVETTRQSHVYPVEQSGADNQPLARSAQMRHALFRGSAPPLGAALE